MTTWRPRKGPEVIVRAGAVEAGGGDPCGQYRLNKQDISKGSAFEGEIVMLGTFATKASTDVFDDATIETQAPGSDQGSLGGQIGTHALEQAVGLLLGNEGTVNDALPQHLDGSGKTDAIGVQALGLSRLPHQAADGIMGQQEGVELLQDQLGRAAAQGLLAEALLISGLVDGLFNFPAFVIAQTQPPGGRLLRGEQGGDEAMDLAHLRIGGATVAMHARGSDLLQLLGHLRVNEVLNDAYLQGSRQALAGRGGKGRQVAAIGPTNCATRLWKSSS